MRGTLTVVTAPSTLELREYEVPAPGPGQVLMRVTRANVCGSDVHAYHWESPALRGAALGHEFVGQVVALGDGVTTDHAGTPVAIGDRIVPVYFLACLRCAACQRGDLSMCTNALRAWSSPPDVSPHFRGGFATHYVVDADQFFYKVPDTLPDEVAAGANCGVAQVIFALDRIGLRAGQTLVVQGAGGLGVYATAYAKRLGARVVVVDAVAARLDLVRRFGADHTINMRDLATTEARVEAVQAVTAEQGADVVLEVAGVAAAFPEAVALVRLGGRIVSMGNLNIGEANEVPFAPGLLTRKQATVVGILRYEPWYLRRALDFLEQTVSALPYHELASAEFPLSDVATAFRKSESREVARAAIVP
ncbi:MAG: zinc-binding dehydrogenase [Candidatus Nanopelagicales bacterium]